MDEPSTTAQTPKRTWRHRRWWRPALTAAVALVTVGAGGIVTVADASTTTWRRVATGTGSTCAVKSDRTLWCWGINTGYALGRTNEPDVVVPTQFGTWSDWEDVSLGSYKGCGLRDGGKLYCWGSNSSGELGLGDTSPRVTPTRVGSGTWKQVALSFDHTCGIRTDHKLFCWGNNAEGQLGTHDRERRLTPTKLSDSAWSHVSEGASAHRCAIRSDFLAYCWGSNSHGQTAGATDETVPTLVPGDIEWKSIATGGTRSCGRSQANRLYCWGYSEYSGALGLGGINQTDVPTKVVASDWREIVLGGSSCGLEADSDVVRRYCWGDGWHGATGLNNQNLYSTPKRRAGETIQFTSLAAGTWHVCGLTTDSELYCWGDNYDGQLGNGEHGDGGTVSYELTPQKVEI